MALPKLKIVHTFHGNTGVVSGQAQDYLLTKSDTVFIVVKINFIQENEIFQFSDLKSALEFSRNNDLVYRFIEYTNIEDKRRILVIYNLEYTDKIVAYQNFYGIGLNCKLFVNSKTDVVIEQMKIPNENIIVRFKNFPTDNTFYLHLSCLIYTLTNYKLESESEILNTFEKVLGFFKIES